MNQITLSGAIGWDVTAQDLRDALKAANGSDVEIVISSPGGFVSTGLEMFNLIRNYPGQTTARLSGYAMSIASYIPLAADRIIAEDNAIYMIHNVRGGVFGDHNDILNYGNTTKGMSKLIARAYAKRTGKDISEVETMMDCESYFFGQDMVDHGFVDELITTTSDKDAETAKALACMAFSECVNRMASDLTAARQDLAACSTIMASAASYIAASKPNEKEENKMTKDEFINQHPEIYQEILKEGQTADASALSAAREEGAAAERARIQSVEAACLPGHEALIAQLKYDGKSSGGDAALMIVGAENKLRAGALAALTTEANPQVPAAAAEATGDSTDAGAADENATVEEQAAAEWNKNPQLKNEFTSQEAYVAYRRKQEAGRVRILNKK